MPIIRPTVKAKLKAKINELRSKEQDVDTDDLLSELMLILLDELMQNGTVTGICGGPGSLLTQGKIT